MKIIERDLHASDGRTLHVHDAGGDGIPIFWHHGTPNIGEPPAPLMAAARERGFRWIGHDRPGYGGSTARPGRDIASVVDDVVTIADALAIDRFAVMGHSGGAPHALACAAIAPERVLAAVCVAGLAPRSSAGLDWFDGMARAGAAELRAAVNGRQELAELLETSDFDPDQFTPADREALEGEWGWFHGIVERALEGGLDGMIDDDLAQVGPWGFDPSSIGVPVLIVHGEDDRIVPPAHGAWLAAHCPEAHHVRRPGHGHLSVLSSGVDALDWLQRVT